MLIAVAVGSFSAFIGGRVDSLLMEFVNIWLTIPKFPLLAVLATVLALKDVVMLSVLMAILDWPALARQVRSQVLSLKSREYIEAATMLDLGTPRIIFRELLPNMMSFIAISTIFEMTHQLLISGDLLFVGKVGGTRTDEDARVEWHSLQRVLTSFPDAATVWPGHDYGVRPSSTIALEKQTNPFLLCPDVDAFLKLKREWPSFKSTHGLK
jgi:hypothetical protein